MSSDLNKSLVLLHRVDLSVTVTCLWVHHKAALRLMMPVVPMVPVVHVVLRRHATTRVHAVVEIWRLFHTATLRTGTCCHVQGLSILCNDTTAATEGADQTCAAIFLAATQSFIQVAAAIHEEERWTGAKRHQEKAWPIVANTCGIKGVRCTCLAAEVGIEAVHKTRLARGIQFILTLEPCRCR